MTVSAQTPLNRSTANGVTTVFPYNFKILAAGDLEVSIDGVIKTLTTHYTLSGVGDDGGGNVTMLSAPPASSIVVRRRNMAYTRGTDYQDQGELPTATLDADFDATVLLTQQLAEGLSRSIQVPVTSDLDPEQLIADLTQASIDAVAAADAAAISETNAAASASTASTAATSATSSASTASTAATSATASASTASTAATSATASASAASTSAGTASTAATAAGGSATTAGTAATTATTQAGNASTSATNAGNSATAAAASAVAAAASAASVSFKPSVRQCVLEGPVDSSGYAAFGGSVGSATLTAAGTLKATAAAGGDANNTGSITNPAWTSPAGSGAGFLMLAITSGGVVSTSVRTLSPAWQFGGTYSTTADQLTFNEQEATMKAGNGAGGTTQVFEVCVGECPYTSGSWSGTIIWYQLRAIYDAIFAVSATQLYAKNANIGGPCDLFLNFSTAATGLTGGTNEEVPYGGPGDGPNSNYRGCLFGQSTRNVVRVRTQDLFQIMDASGASSNPSSGYVRIRALRRFR